MDSEQIIFEIIANAGEARDLSYQALSEVEDEQIDEAKKLADEADKVLNKAHNAQTKLIQAEINGEEVDGGLLMIHAQDHLMTAVTEHQMITRMIPIFEKLMINKEN